MPQYGRVGAAACVSAALMGASARARPQAQEWSDAFLNASFDGAIRTMEAVDLGAGERLLIGGEFLEAGGVAARGLAVWDGRMVSSLGGGPGAVVHDIAVFDDGTGPAPYAVGNFATAPGERGLAKWSGSAWEPIVPGIQSGSAAIRLGVFDSGEGQELYITGSFNTIGGLSVDEGVARWDGQVFRTVRGPTGTIPLASIISNMVVHDDGSGPALYAAGRWRTPDDSAVLDGVGRWDGSSWTFIGHFGSSPNVLLSAVYNGEPVLYAAGRFNSAGGAEVNSIAMWDGEEWRSPGLGVEGGQVNALAAVGEVLYVAGDFSTAGGLPARRIATWDGVRWSSIANGPDGPVWALGVVWEDGRERVYAGGGFTFPGTRLAVIEGSTLRAVGNSVEGSSGGPEVRSLASVDLGGTQKLFVGGRFDGVAGGAIQSKNLAAITGDDWIDLGPGASLAAPNAGVVNVVKPVSVGGMPALLAGGGFTMVNGVNSDSLALFDGSQWQDFPGALNGDVTAAVEVELDGQPSIVVAGSFTSIDGAVVNHVARWDGAAWRPMDTGFDRTPTALVAFDDGQGPTVYAGGNMSRTGGIPSEHVALLDGGVWSEFATLPADVKDFLEFDDGAGPVVYAAAGAGSAAGGAPVDRIYRWLGGAWLAVAGDLAEDSLDSRVNALEAFDDGSGAKLYAAGRFGFGASPSVNVAFLSEGQWRPAGAGLDGEVLDLVVFDDGSGAALYAAGQFQASGADATVAVARWDGTVWEPVGSYGNAGPDTFASVLEVVDLGAGLRLYAAGSRNGEHHVSAWNGGSWIDLGPATFGFDGPVRCLGVFDAGAGPMLYAGGSFLRAHGAQSPGVAIWDGFFWLPVGDGLSGSVRDLQVHEIGGEARLIAGGSLHRSGDTSLQNVAVWDGAAWSSLPGADGDIHIVKPVTIDGRARLLVAGEFQRVADSPLGSVVRWTGTTWEQVGSSPSGASPPVSALAVYDDGSGGALYAGGEFGEAGGTSVRSIAKWTGQDWVDVGGGAGSGTHLGRIYAMQPYDDGTGSALYVGGIFTEAGGVPANSIARWNGHAWSALGDGIMNHANGATNIGVVRSLAVHDEGRGPVLYVGGTFDLAGGTPSGNLARYGPAVSCSADLDGNQTVDVLDLLAYLDLWFTAEAGAERTHDDPPIINVFDLLGYLDEWFGSDCR